MKKILEHSLSSFIAPGILGTLIFGVIGFTLFGNQLTGTLIAFFGGIITSNTLGSYTSSKNLSKKNTLSSGEIQKSSYVNNILWILSFLWLLIYGINPSLEGIELMISIVLFIIIIIVGHYLYKKMGAKGIIS